MCFTIFLNNLKHLNIFILVASFLEEDEKKRNTENMHFYFFFNINIMLV